MDRNGFRNRMKQYKKAREENPGLKYWEWKQKYDSAPQPDSMPGQSQPDQPTVAPQPLDDRAHRWDNEHYVDPVNTTFDADKYRSWKEPAQKTFGKRVKFTYRDFMKTADVKHMKFLQSIGRLGNMLKGTSIFSEVVQNLFPSEESERIEDLRVKMDKQNKWLTGQEDIPMYDEGGEVEPDPLEVLERSKPKIAGIPINDKPLSGTDPIGEAMMWGLGGGAASVALRSLFPTYGATAGWLAFGDNNKENVLIVPNNVNKSKLPVAKDLVNYDVKEFFENDVVPRDVIYPIESKQSFLNDANFMYDIYPESHFEQNVAGYYDNINKKVVVNNLYAGDQKSINRIGTHEFGHKYNDQFELDDPHKRILNNAYTVEENKIGRTARGARRTNEKRETNKNIRYDMYVELQEKLGRSPSPSEVDDFIDSLSDREILRRVRNSNMYGSAYFESISERAQRIKQPIGTYTRTRASKIRKALKQVAMNERSKDNQNYA